MSDPIRSIANPAISLNILADEDVGRIHTATLDLIESVGVRFPSERALDILEAHGAQVDRVTMIARVPGHTIEEFLAKAPPLYALSALDPQLDLPLDGHHSYLGTDGCGVEIVDAFSGKRRTATKQDVSDIARLVDALPAIAFHWVPLSAQDCPPSTRSLHELEAIWSVSRKHVQTETVVTAREARAAIEMAAVLAGGPEALRRRPVLSIMQCSVSPLAHETGSLEAGLVAAEAGVPIGFMTMASSVSTAPATLAGTLVVGNAEVLSALALMQMARPGCPVFYAAAQTSADLRTGAYTGGGPEDFLFGAASNVLADFYRLPLSMGAYATGAKEPGWQAGVDSSFSAFMALSTGADMLLGAGLLHGSRIFSYDELLMDVEIWDILHAMFQGIDVNGETLALDAIRDVGPGGNFFAHRHTLKHMHERWQPMLMDRRPYTAWEQTRDGAREWAAARAREILASHRPEPLDARQAAELRQIVEMQDSE